MKRILFPFLLLVIGLAAVSAFATLKIATAPGSPPYEFYDEKGKLVGYDIDIMNAICAKLNESCEYHATSFESIIPGIVYKKYDVGISDFGITEERKKSVYFSLPYESPTGGIYLVRGDAKNTNINDFKVVATEAGTLASSYINKKTKATTKAYDSVVSAVLDMKSGRADAVFLDYLAAVGYVETDNSVKLLGEAIVDPIMGEGIGIALSKNIPHLKERVDQAITELTQEGVMDQFRKKWFPNEK